MPVFKFFAGNWTVPTIQPPSTLSTRQSFPELSEAGRYLQVGNLRGLKCEKF